MHFLTMPESKILETTKAGNMNLVSQTHSPLKCLTVKLEEFFGTIFFRHIKGLEFNLIPDAPKYQSFSFGPVFPLNISLYISRETFG